MLPLREYPRATRASQPSNILCVAKAVRLDIVGVRVVADADLLVSVCGRNHSVLRVDHLQPETPKSSSQAPLNDPSHDGARDAAIWTSGASYPLFPSLPPVSPRSLPHRPRGDTLGPQLPPFDPTQRHTLVRVRKGQLPSRYSTSTPQA